MNKVFQILSVAVIVLTAASCGGGSVQITYSAEPLAAVLLNGKWGFIDTKGNEAVPCKYDYVQESFSEGLAAVELDGRWFYIDKTGKVILKLDKKYKYVYAFSDGLALVGGSDFIDKTGKVVISLKDKDGTPKYYDARSFHDGRAAVRKSIEKDGWGFIDTTGTEVIPCQYFEVTDFANGRAFVEANVGTRDQYGNKRSYREKTMINRNGDAVVKTNMNHVGEFSPEGWALHKSFTLSGRIDDVYFVNSENYTLSYVNDSKFTDANPFTEGLASVNVFNEEIGKRRWGFINKDGKTVISPIWYDAGEFHEGLAAVQQVEKYEDGSYYSSIYERGGKWGFIDKSGKTVIPFRYETSTIRSYPAVVGFEYDHSDYPYFSEGIALVKRDDKYGFIDKTGREVIPCKYKSAQVFSGGFARVVSNNDKFGIIDKTGREIVPCAYAARDQLSQFSNGLCAIRRGDKWGFVDTTGKEVIPCKYGRVTDFK